MSKLEDLLKDLKTAAKHPWLILVAVVLVLAVAFLAAVAGEFGRSIFPPSMPASGEIDLAKLQERLEALEGVGSRGLDAEQIRRLVDAIQTNPGAVRPSVGTGTVSKFWTPGVTINVAFLSGDAELQRAVKEAAALWEREANIRFAFGSREHSEIRISFDQSGNWSYIGIDALGISVDQPTLNLGSLIGDEDARTRTILHQLGHALGLIHEHQIPNAAIQWNWERMYELLSGPPSFMTVNRVNFNFRSDENADPLYRTKIFDPDSVMMFPIDPEWVAVAIPASTKSGLSEGDAAFIKAVYP